MCMYKYSREQIRKKLQSFDMEIICFSINSFSFSFFSSLYFSIEDILFLFFSHSNISIIITIIIMIEYILITSCVCVWIFSFLFWLICALFTLLPFRNYTRVVDEAQTWQLQPPPPPSPPQLPDTTCVCVRALSADRAILNDINGNLFTFSCEKKVFAPTFTRKINAHKRARKIERERRICMDSG